MKIRIEGSIEVEPKGGVETTQVRILVEARDETGKGGAFDHVVEANVWNSWSPERRRDFVAATVRSVFSNLLLGEVTDDLR